MGGSYFCKIKCLEMNFSIHPILNMDSNLDTKTVPGLRRKLERIILGSGKNDFLLFFIVCPFTFSSTSYVDLTPNLELIK